MPELSSEEREVWLKTDESKQTLYERRRCAHCGGAHLRACPRVRSMTFTTSGAVESVKFWRDGQWDASAVVWPEDIFDFEDELVTKKELETQ